MPRPEDPVQFPEDLCPECAHLTFWLLQRLLLAAGVVCEAMADNVAVQWGEVVAVIDQAREQAEELRVHHEALDHDPPDEDEE